jgi:hypothetical protein
MIFGLFRKHKLPAFPPEAARVFEQLCSHVPEEDIGSVRNELDRCIVALKRDVYDGRFKNHLPLVESLSDISLHLLDLYPQLSVSQRSLVIGAIRYFAIGEDSLSDTHFATGFNDDIRVMNYVLEELGIHDRYIPLP